MSIIYDDYKKLKNQLIEESLKNLYVNREQFYL